MLGRLDVLCDQRQSPLVAISGGLYFNLINLLVAPGVLVSCESQSTVT